MTGFSLIENLITLVILSVGLLGIAGLQMTALRINHQASMQNEAVNLVASLVDRMRVNPAGVTTGGYLATAAQDNSCYSSCTAMKMAKNDLWQWKQQIDHRLPGVGGVCEGRMVANDNTNGVSALVQACTAATGLYTIWLIWDGNHDGIFDNPFNVSLTGDSSHMITVTF